MILQKLINPKLSVPALAFICALYLAIANNLTFFRAAFNAVSKAGQRDLVFEGSLILCLIALFYILLMVLSSIKFAFKGLLITLLMVAASVSYFMDNYGTIIDVSMIQNLLETDVNEALELITFKLVAHLVVLGVLPALWVYRADIQYQLFGTELLKRVALTLGAVILLAGTVYLNYKDFSFVLRNNHSLRYLINPNYPIYSLVKYVTSFSQTPLVVAPLGEDAKQQLTWQARGKKSVVVLVVGETARAENFELNGYSQATNPRLSKENIINFPDTHSCGTATAVSLPCMFSNLKHKGFSDSAAKQSENLLDVLRHAQLDVYWLDNNSGCKGVCQRVTAKNTEILEIPNLCNEGECYDDVMLAELQKHLDQLSGDGVVVLHQKGSHGPAYYKRYPPAFKVFTPECTQSEVQNCSQAEIRNAYDNTLLYTDHFLAEVIKLLKNNAANYHTAMLYMSDHGESLGENGIYLHGLPYAFAPDQQTHIPFIMWLSPSFSDSFGIDTACLTSRRQATYSHDNLFHSMLGLLAVETKVYEKDYDLFAPCRLAPS